MKEAVTPLVKSSLPCLLVGDMACRCPFGGVAQLGEQELCKLKVGSSSLPTSTILGDIA